MSQTSKQFGDEGEELAAELLQNKSYEIVERNYRFGKGEIDIIAKSPDKKFLIFVEVKSRKNLEFGEPEYAITKNKMSQLRKIASAYIYEKEINEDVDFRFDVVAILFRQKQKPLIEHYENAF
ncbi:MAG: YraN family protein [Ignavibacteriaceae bacterium]